MDIQYLRSKILFWIFCVSMIIIFYVGLAYPEQTDFWLVKNGVPILILEAFSLFSTALLLIIAGVNSPEIKPSTISKIFYGFLLIPIFFGALYWAYIYDIWLFIYFLISNGVKYYTYSKIKTNQEANAATNIFITSFVSFISSAFIAIPISPFLRNIFPNQIQMLYQFEKGLPAIIAVADNEPEYSALWGILYFVFLIIIDWVLDILSKNSVDT